MEDAPPCPRGGHPSCWGRRTSPVESARTMLNSLDPETLQTDSGTPSRPRRVVFVSNGHGEDRIAAAIARRWNVPGTTCVAFPIVGDGHALQEVGLPVVAPTLRMPSGGFILRSVRALWHDLREGLLGLTLRQIAGMRRMRGDVDLVVAVGDVVPLFFAWLSRAPFVFVGCAKSDHYLGGRFGSYGLLERWFIRHPRCRAIYPRDGQTARNLIERGYRARDLGNPMMDDLEAPPDTPWPLPEGCRRIGFLPGSRDEAYDNFPGLLTCCEAIARTAPYGAPVAFYAAIAPTLDVARLAGGARSIGWRHEATSDTLEGPDGLRVQLCRGQFGAWIHLVEGVVGLAGTANEQCVGMGLPAVTYAGTGPQFNAHFAEAQTRLLGESVSRVDPHPDNVARELWAMLTDRDRLERIRKNGTARMGSPGASSRIVADAASHLTGGEPWSGR